MSTFAQRIQLGPFFSAGELLGASLLEHYAAGTNNLQDIWEDRNKTIPLAQPFEADADGVFNFFADGLYKIILKSADGTVLYTLDNWQCIDRTDPTFGEGALIGSASTIAIGPEIFAHIGGSTNITTITGTIPFFWAVFDGNLTLIYSANLLTPASIDLAVKTNDICFFLNEGAGVWRIAGYSQFDGFLIATQDARTNSVDQALIIRSTTSGTPAMGVGTGILLQAESADEAPSDFGQLEFVASDVAAGTEDTYLQVLLRVAGAALSAAYRWIATTANKAIFTHANTADRTYTLPNVSGTILLREQTATGSAASASSFNVTLNDSSFSPSISDSGGSGVMSSANIADPGDTIGRFRLTVVGTGTVRWRYISATDDPTIWISYDPFTGEIKATWASDDPIPFGIPGIIVDGMVSVMLKAHQLEHLTDLSAKAGEARDWIRERKMKLEHEAYRALQLTANDLAPSPWLLMEYEMDTTTSLLRIKQKV